MKSYRVQIKTVSPVHVGTGEVYEPTEFFLNEEKRTFVIIDFERLCEHLSGSQFEQFKRLCVSGTLESLVKLYDFIDRTCLDLWRQGVSDFVKREINLGADIIGHYKRVKRLSGRELSREFNKFTIQRTAFSLNEGVPIIPGSAVKGAIRTEVLNRRRHKVRGKDWRHYCQQRGPRQRLKCDSKQLESEILKYPRYRFHQDPFRLVKVSDFRPLGEVKTRIIYAVNRKKDGGRARGPYQILEVVESGAVFEGEITFLDSYGRVENSVTFEEILEALKSFYGREREREFEEVQRIGANPPVFPNEAFPLRVGRHSGAECVTIEGFRRIFIKGRRGTYQKHATTLWVASEDKKGNRGLRPFGWVVFYEAGEKSEKGPQKNQALDLSKLGKRFKLVVRKHNA